MKKIKKKKEEPDIVSSDIGDVTYMFVDHPFGFLTNDPDRVINELMSDMWIKHMYQCFFCEMKETCKNSTFDGGSDE